jgi:hypothetical protein
VLGARGGQVSGATFVCHVEFFTPAGHKDLDDGGGSRVASSHSTRFSRLSAHFLLRCARALFHAPVIQ